ncbi:hypothetical protein ES703_96218 [subsurface metagenome]
MARIRLGPTISDISGSVGGGTFQRNPHGLIMRNKPLPIKTETAAQYTVRYKMRSLLDSWRALTPENRLMWQRFIDYSGQTIRRDKSVTMSGYNLYLKYQILLLLYDQSILIDIAWVPLPAVPTISGISSDGTIFMIYFSAEINPATLFFILKLGYPTTTLQKFSAKGLRFMKVVWGTQTDWNIATPYLKAFGLRIPEDSYVSYSLQFFSTISPVVSGVFTGVFECTYDL